MKTSIYKEILFFFPRTFLFSSYQTLIFPAVRVTFALSWVKITRDQLFCFSCFILFSPICLFLFKSSLYAERVNSDAVGCGTESSSLAAEGFYVVVLPLLDSACSCFVPWAVLMPFLYKQESHCLPERATKSGKVSFWSRMTWKVTLLV